MDAHLEAARRIAILPSVRCGLTAWFVREDEEKEEYNNEGNPYRWSLSTC